MKPILIILFCLCFYGCGKKPLEPVVKIEQITETQNEEPLASKSQVNVETTKSLETKKKKTALEEAGYKGRVKSVKLVGPHLVQISKFDKKGNLIENTVGSDIKAIYNYDDNGNLAEMVFSEKGKVTETRDYDYDGKGNQIQMVVRDGSGEITEKHIFKYDVDGNKAEEKVDYNKGKFFRKYTFKYDDKGNEVEMLTKKSNGDITGRNTTLYDRKGNEVARIGYLPSGKILVKTTLRYDVKGNKIEMTIHDINGIVITNHIFKYDAKGDLIERVIGGYSKSKISYTNDKMSNPIKAETSKSWDSGKTWSGSPSVESWEYTYWD